MKASLHGTVQRKIILLKRPIVSVAPFRQGHLSNLFYVKSLIILSELSLPESGNIKT